MKLFEVSKKDVHKYQLGNRLAAQVKNTKSQLDRYIADYMKLKGMIERETAEDPNYETDLLDLLFDLEHAKEHRGMYKALNRMEDMIKKGNFEVK